MRTANATSLLDAWDEGHAQHAQRWALTMLALAEPQASVEALTVLSVGQRDARLLALRSTLFGSMLAVAERCPRCNVDTEVVLDSGDLLLPAPAQHDADFTLCSEGCSVRFRLPNSLDLIAATGCADIAQAQALLLERCVIEAFRGDVPISPSALPSASVSAIADRMGQLDPQADLHLSLCCAECRHEWKVMFDVLPFLWCELNAWATRVLREVHRLAIAYGWGEGEILSMSAARRRHYLAIIGA